MIGERFVDWNCYVAEVEGFSVTPGRRIDRKEEV